MMDCVDVNVLVHAVNQGSPCFDQARGILTGGAGAVAMLPIVAIGFLRITTSAAILEHPLTAGQADGFLTSVMALPHVHMPAPSSGHWAIFQRLHQIHAPRGGDVTDAYLAACAMDLGARLVSYDRGFKRFAGLDWVDAAQSRPAG